MKKALLIEINYKNTKYETNGEVSIESIELILKNKYLYTDIFLLKESNDEKPTKNNIINAIINLINPSNNCDEIWIHYMGHSTIVFDNKNEYIQKGLVPLDYELNGFIYDCELQKLLSNIKCNLYVILDCCYGSYGYNSNYSLKIINGKFIKEENPLENILSFIKEEKIQEKTQYTKIFISYYINILNNDILNNDISNIISRRMIEIFEESNYNISIDKFLIRMYNKLNESLYYSHIIVVSSNNTIIGKNNFLVNLGLNNSLNIKYNIIENKKNKEIKDKQNLLKNQFNLFPIIKKIESKLINKDKIECKDIIINKKNKEINDKQEIPYVNDIKFKDMNHIKTYYNKCSEESKNIIIERNKKKIKKNSIIKINNIVKINYQ